MEDWKKEWYANRKPNQWPKHPQPYNNPNWIDELDLATLRKLAGIDDFNKPGQDAAKLKQMLQARTGQAAEKRKIEREQNIRPGTDEWFKLWFSRGPLDGNMPAPFRGRKRK